MSIQAFFRLAVQFESRSRVLYSQHSRTFSRDLNIIAALLEGTALNHWHLELVLFLGGWLAKLSAWWRRRYLFLAAPCLIGCLTSLHRWSSIRWGSFCVVVHGAVPRRNLFDLCLNLSVDRVWVFVHDCAIILIIPERQVRIVLARLVDHPWSFFKSWDAREFAHPL